MKIKWRSFFLISLVLTLFLMLTACSTSGIISSGPPTKETYRCSFKNLINKQYYYAQAPTYAMAVRLAQKKCLTESASPTAKCYLHYCEKL